MNRMEEYRELRMELEQNVPDLDKMLERAMKKKKRQQRVWRSMVGLAASFVLFVLLVNFSSTVAYACSQVPILRELAEAVKFSRSLSDAVENDYVQEINWEQIDGDIFVKMEYMIVDQKQVNVFYRVYSKSGDLLYVNPEVLSADGTPPPPCSYSNIGEYNQENGELRSVIIDFMEEDVPEELLLKLNICEMHGELITTVDFLLEFDLSQIAPAKEFTVNETIILDGQKITITNVEVYPTHMRVNIMDDVDNTAWLNDLHFYIVTDTGEVFEPVSNGITATGGDSPTILSFRADSSYFYEAKKLKVVVTGAEWLSKDWDRIQVNLKTGEADKLPGGVDTISVEKVGNDWVIQLRAMQRDTQQDEYSFHQILSMEYYDEAGNRYEMSGLSHFVEYWQEGSNYFIEEVILEGYQREEVWLVPRYSHMWKTKESIVVDVK